MIKLLRGRLEPDCHNIGQAKSRRLKKLRRSLMILRIRKRVELMLEHTTN